MGEKDKFLKMFMFLVREAVEVVGPGKDKTLRLTKCDFGSFSL